MTAPTTIDGAMMNEHDKDSLLALADRIEQAEETPIGVSLRAATLIRALLSASKPATPEGWKLVPVEPTPEMILKGGIITLGMPLNERSVKCIYAAMLSVSPDAVAPAQSGEPVAKFELTDSEIQACSMEPAILRLLANTHEDIASDAETLDNEVRASYHVTRASELNAKADAEEREMKDRGDYAAPQSSQPVEAGEPFDAMKHQTLLGYDASGDAIFGTDPEALAQHKASCSAVVLDDERAAQAAQAAEYAEYLARSACDNGDSREFVKPMLDAILAASPQAKKCATCNGHGMIGGPSYYAPDEGGEPCPDCATATPYRWSESEHIIGSGNGIRDIARHIHWPECWDMATYPSLAHAVHEMILSTAFRCGNDDCKQATATQPVQTALTVWYGTDSCTCQKATATQAAQTERAARKEKS